MPGDLFQHVRFKRELIIRAGDGDAMRCDAMRCDAMRCDAMRCDAMRCDAMKARVGFICSEMKWAAPG
jgi:hypothetical protein